MQDMSGQKQKIWGSFGKWWCQQIKHGAADNMRVDGDFLKLSD